jgi:16S rRNA (uracil1498-N3)-methyltransferase
MVEVRSVDEGSLTAALVGGAGPETHAGDSPALPPILLFQALPKGSKMDLIVRQAAEGALSEVVPFAAERSPGRLEDLAPRRGGGEKWRRWERIIREALQQSGSPVPTALHPPLDGDGLFAYWDELRSAHPGALGIVFHQDALETGPGPDPLAPPSLHRYLSKVPEILALAVGPEGGFSPAEVSRFLEAGFWPLKIGDTILRTETAALYGAAAARIVLLENSSWIQKPR